MTVPRHGCFLDKRIVNALVVDGGRLRFTLGFVVSHDEILADRPDDPRKTDLVSADPLEIGAVLHTCDLIDIVLGARRSESKRPRSRGSRGHKWE